MRPEKKSITEEIRSQANRSSYVLLADYQRMGSAQFSELRQQLAGAGAEMHVVKNRLFHRVAAEHGWGQLDGILHGPSAMIVGGKEIAEVARILAKFKSETQLPTLKGGMLGTLYLTPATIAELALLPSREELRAKLAGTLVAPLVYLVGVLQQKVASIVYVLKAIEEKKRAQG